jgi:hypothetical protein
MTLKVILPAWFLGGGGAASMAQKSDCRGVWKPLRGYKFLSMNFSTTGILLILASKPGGTLVAKEPESDQLVIPF